MEETSEVRFDTILPVTVYTRPAGDSTVDWQELDRGEGTYRIPAGLDISVRIHNIGDSELARLVRELEGVSSLTYLNLSENRKISDDGLKILRALTQLTQLNLSSCGISNEGLPYLAAFPRLERLDLSFCNRITDTGIKVLKNLSRLTFLDLQGCVKVTNGGLARIRRRGLEIHK